MTLTQPSTEQIAAQQAAAQPIAAYLADLRSQLAPIAPAEREEILREITAHIRDSAEMGTPIDTVLARLGTPAELAAEDRDSQLIRTASSSFSPVLLLRATLRLATKGPPASSSSSPQSSATPSVSDSSSPASSKPSSPPTPVYG
jgi:hypothetical protein